MPRRIGVSGGVGIAVSAFDEVHEHLLVALAGGRREVFSRSTCSAVSSIWSAVVKSRQAVPSYTHA